MSKSRCPVTGKRSFKNVDTARRFGEVAAELGVIDPVDVYVCPHVLCGMLHLTTRDPRDRERRRVWGHLRSMWRGRDR